MSQMRVCGAGGFCTWVSDGKGGARCTKCGAQL